MDTDTVEAPTETPEATPGIDIDAAVDQIGASLFPEHGENKETTPQESVAAALTDRNGTPGKEAQPVVPEIPPVRPAPKSWAKEVHEHWGKIDPKAQDYIEKREKDFLNGIEQYKGAAQYAQDIQKVLTPYQPLLQSKGLDAPRAIDDMLGAYARLTQGTMESRQAALMQVAKNLGVVMPTPSNGTDPVTPVDPRLSTIEQQLQELREAQTVQQRAALKAAQEKATIEVNTFAADPKHALFDDCHEDIVKFLTLGDSLQEAYDKAVWANPVTREKEKSSWFQTETEKAKERARLDALPKQKARSVNVQSRDTQRTPTEPLGSMEDTLRSTYRSMKDKTTH